MVNDSTPRPSSGWHRRILKTFGVDRAIGYTVLLQAFSLVSRPTLLALMVVCLTVEEQGYQYTILALIGLKALFEMGLGISLAHFVGRESGRVTISTATGISGDPAALARVASLFQKTAVAYACLAVIFVLILLPGGWAFLSSSGQADGVRWHAALMVSVVGTALAIPVEGLGAYLIGGGQIVPILRIRLIVSVVQAALYGLLLATGFGLLAAPIGSFGSMFLQTVVIATRYRLVIRDLWFYHAGTSGVNWRREMFPFQWRVGLSWLSNYFLTQVLIPIAFRFCGQAAAGRLGLSLAVASILHGFAFGWVSTKVPRYGALLSEGRRAELQISFLKDLRFALVVYVFGGASALACLGVLAAWRPEYEDRVLDTGALLAILGMGFCGLITECLAVCLNAFHRDPLMPIRLAAAIVTTGGASAAAYLGDIRHVVVAAFCTSATATVISWVVWRRCMARWQIPPQEPAEL